MFTFRNTTTWLFLAVVTVGVLFVGLSVVRDYSSYTEDRWNVKLYSGGEVVEQWEATDFYLTSSCAARFTAVDSGVEMCITGSIVAKRLPKVHVTVRTLEE